MTLGIAATGTSSLELTALVAVQAASELITNATTRLSTGWRINSGADDPAGYMAMQQFLSDLTGIDAASSNASRAQGMVDVADSSLSQVHSLLNDVEGHVIEIAGGGLSDAEIAAKEMEISAALEGIDRIGATTQFMGTKLLDGSKESLSFSFSPDLSEYVSVDLPTVTTTALGGDEGVLADLAAGGDADPTSDPQKAQSIVRAARDGLLASQAELGSFAKYTVESSQQMLSTLEIATTEALSAYATDFAKAMTDLTMGQTQFTASLAALSVSATNRDALLELLAPSS